MPKDAKAKVKLKSKIQPKKKAKSPARSKAPAKKSESEILHQAFIKSLAALMNFWDKRCSTLKKAVDTLETKHHKAELKQKAALGKKNHETLLHAFEEVVQALKEAKETWMQAKEQSEKFNSLSKMIHQFEADWLKAPILPLQESPAMSHQTYPMVKPLVEKISPIMDPVAFDTEIEEEIELLEEEDEIPELGSEFEMLNEMDPFEDENFDEYDR